MRKSLFNDLLLVAIAFIWGTTFVAQSISLDQIPPFLFNAARFSLALVFLVPLYLLFRKRQGKFTLSVNSLEKAGIIKPEGVKSAPFAGILIGLFLFSGISAQQVGLNYTSVANAGFITSLYIVLVPIIGRFFGFKINIHTLIGVILASLGLYFLAVGENFSLSRGDSLQLIGALFWAGHVLTIGYFSPRFDPVLLSIYQFATTAFLSFLMALGLENIKLAYILNAALPLLYAGIVSTGVAFTLQIIAQKRANPTKAAVIFSTESLFAAASAWLILGETMTNRQIFGATLMFVAVIFAQEVFRRRTN